jgi:hypothetical protein
MLQFAHAQMMGMPQSQGYNNANAPLLQQQDLNSLNEMVMSNPWLSSCRGALQSKIWPEPPSMASLFSSLTSAEFAAAQRTSLPFPNFIAQFHATPPFSGPHMHAFPHAPAHTPDGPCSPDASHHHGFGAPAEGGADGGDDDAPRAPASAAGGVNRIFPRRKAGQTFRLNSKPVVLDDKVLAVVLVMIVTVIIRS